MISRILKHVAPERAAVTSLNFSIGRCGLWIAFLSLLVPGRSWACLLLFFSTMTCIYPVGWFGYLWNWIPSFSSDSRSDLSFEFNTSSILLGGHTMAVASSFICRWHVSRITPIQLNRSIQHCLFMISGKSTVVKGAHDGHEDSTWYMSFSSPSSIEVFRSIISGAAFSTLLKVELQHNFYRISWVGS